LGAAVDVYLLPGVVGGGIGDVDEVLCAGRYLARAGFSLTLYRRPGRPLPDAVDARWAWPPVRRCSTLAPRAPRALTVAPAWGITAAPARPEALGRPGPWAEEATAIERRYGAERTLHVSLEEFARNLTAERETVERLREGGVRSRAIRSRLRRARAAGEVAAFRRAFRTFRAFDRPNVLSLFAAFRRDAGFDREFPEAVQVGPLWPGRSDRALAVPDPDRAVWYASPASAETLAPEVMRGLAMARSSPRLLVRAPRPWRSLRSGPRLTIRPGPIAAPAWRRELRRASLRIVTGSRSLLEAIELGGPFLYFNGVLGRGPARRRHRPEKIAQFLDLARGAGWPDDLLRDLADFARGRRVAEVVARAMDRHGGWARFPAAPRAEGFAPGFEDAGRLLVRVARAFADPESASPALVAGFRRAARR
jgi:hypothetical protein